MLIIIIGYCLWIVNGNLNTTEHDNWFYLENNDGANLDIAFTVTDYFVTSGQPYGGVTSSGNGINVRAGRHGSSDAAAWFKNGLSPSNMWVTDYCNTPPQTPQKLNFAIEGVLRIGNCKFSPFKIAQGHYSASAYCSQQNNWWMGSPACSSTQSATDGTCSFYNPMNMITFSGTTILSSNVDTYNIHEQCGKPNSTPKPTPKPMTVYMIVCGILALLFIIVVGTVCLIRKKGRDQRLEQKSLVMNSFAEQIVENTNNQTI